ncbi:FecR family protein [Sphingomonas sp. CJ20]
MIGRLRMRSDRAVRERAAQRFLAWRAQDAVLDPVRPSDADAAATEEMRRVWALTGAVADDPRLRDALRSDLARFAPERRARRPRALAAAIALMLAVPGAGLVAWHALAPEPEAVAASGHHFFTGVGQRTRIVLADTSSVSIDTDSALLIQMDEHRRSVTLQRGRAFFKVAKDRTRPFVVTAGNKQVRAVGTAFEVRIDRNRVVVTVVEGVVEVTERGPRRPVEHEASIEAGTQLVAHDDNAWDIGQIDPKQATSWLTGRLSFMGEPLADAVEQMNGYSRRKLVFRGNHIPDERIVGVFRSGDTEALAQAIELNGFGRIVASTPEQIEIEVRE